MNGKTPAELAGVDLRLDGNRWKDLFASLISQPSPSGMMPKYNLTNPESKEHKDEYLGRKSPETKQKALLKEKEYTLKQIGQLQDRLTEIDNILGAQDGLVSQQIPKCYPFVKWAGGKTQLTERMYRYFPKSFNKYFEPFLGGGAVFFYLTYKRPPPFPAILSDVNHDLINAYEVIRDNMDELIKRLTKRQIDFRKVPDNKVAKSEFYNKIRSNPPNIDQEPVERANWFIFLNKTCYNGLYRVNSEGKFNVPYGDYPNATLFEEENLRNIHTLLNRKDIEIFWKDYAIVLLENAKEDDFVYLDPPYYSENNKGFTGYNASLFTKEDQRKLADVVRTLAERGCKVALSNADAEFIRNLFKDTEPEGHKYSYTTLEALRVINCKGSARTGAKELLIRTF